MFRLHAADLHQAIRSTGYALAFKQDALLWLVGFQQLWLVHFNLCCFCLLFPRQFAVTWLSCWCVSCCRHPRLDFQLFWESGCLSSSQGTLAHKTAGNRAYGHPCFWKFYSIIPVDVVVRAKSSLNGLFDPACVPMRITISKLYVVQKWVVSRQCC